jgi:hypothetical protein
MFTLTKRLYVILSIVLILLLIPIVAMQFTNEVSWSLFDFIAAGILLLGTGLAIELVLQKVKSTKHRITILGIIMILLFLLWAELAVGIFNSPFAGN